MMWQLALLSSIFLAGISAEVTVLIGGETDGVIQAAVDSVETYSPDCGMFDGHLPPIPTARKSLGAAYLDGFIYICGGYNTIFQVKECFKLDLSDTAKGWIEIAGMSKGRFGHKLVGVNGLIYAVGGEGPFSEHDDIEIYDPATNTWSPGPQLTGFRLSFCVAVSESRGELYIVGGIDQEGGKKRLESLNLATMEWTRLPDMAANRTSCGCATFGNGLLVAGGWGNDVGPNAGDITPVKTAEYFDFEAGKWDEFPAMRHRRTEFVLEAYSDRQLVTAFGGYQGGHLNSVEEFDGELDWDYLAQSLKEPKSDMALVTVPDGLISENCQ